MIIGVTCTVLDTSSDIKLVDAGGFIVLFHTHSVTQATRDQTEVEIIKNPGWKHSKFGRVYLEIILLALYRYIVVDI